MRGTMTIMVGGEGGLPLPSIYFHGFQSPIFGFDQPCQVHLCETEKTAAGRPLPLDSEAADSSLAAIAAPVGTHAFQRPFVV